MRALLFALLAAGSLSAQGLQFFIDSTNAPLSSTTPYQFPSTPAGSSSSITVRITNPSTTTAVPIAAVFLTASPSTSVTVQGFTLTGAPDQIILPPQSAAQTNSVRFTVTFAPITPGPVSAYLLLQLQQNGPFTIITQLQGNATGSAFTLICTPVNVASPIQSCNGGPIQATSTINFGNIPTTTSAAAQFTLTNTGTVALDPQTMISISTPVYDANLPFALTPNPLPATLSPGSSVSFTITYAPGDTSTSQNNLYVGPNSYTLQGTGTASVAGDISSLTIAYTDPTGVRLSAQPATPITFGQLIAGAGTAATLTFTVTNPQTTIGPVTVPSVTVSGAAFSLSGLPTLPVTISPGYSMTFQVAFSGSAVGSYTGTLAIGTRQFPLTGQTVAGLVPSATFTVDQQPLLSKQQAHLTITLPTAPPAALIGQLTMAFTPYNNLPNDPAILFTASNSLSLNVTVPAGTATATYNGQSAVTFQTGTTAGTISFTLQFPNSPALSQSFTIAPALTQITSITAARQAPNLVVTITGYDNTYSAGQLSFVFATSAGSLSVPVDATAAFHNYFFTNNTAGGAFSLQASFPVSNGDVTQISSVSATITNSAGPTSTTQVFQ